MVVADWGAYSGVTGSRAIADASAALIDYAYGTQHSELPGTVRIPKSLALDGLAEFVETGRRPSCITWTET